MMDKEKDNVKRQEFMMAFGRNLKRLRQERGWTQEHLSIIVQIDDKYVHDLETGKKCASSWLAKKLAVAFEVTMDELTATVTGEAPKTL